MSKPLQCPNCGRSIAAKDVNIAKALAKCNHCDVVFNFEEQLKVPTFHKPEALLPSGMEVLRLRSALEIDIKWSKTNSTFLLIFTIFWNAIVIPMGLFALMAGDWAMLLILSVHLSIGIALLYYMLTVFLNTTYISVDSYNLSIEHRPLKLPFYSNQYIPIFEIEQLFVERYSSGKTNGRPMYAFALYAILKNKERIKLIKGLKVYQQALYLEQEIERFLKITDQAVEDEWKG